MKSNIRPEGIKREAKSRVIGNVLSLLYANLLTSIIGIVSIVYVSRVLEPEAYGSLNFSRAVVSYFLLFVAFGFDDYGIIHLAANRETDNAEKLVRSLLGLRLVISLVAYGALVVLVFASSALEPHAVLILIIGLTLLIAAVDVQWVFIALEKSKFFAVARTASQVVYVLLLILLVRSPDDLWKCALLIVANEALFRFLMLVMYSRNVGDLGVLADFAEWKRVLSYSLPLGVGQLAGLLRQNIDLVVLSFYVSARELGLYAAALRLINQAVYVVVVLRKAIYPRIVTASAEQSKSLLRRLNIFCKKYGIVVGVFIGTTTGILSESLVLMIFGSEFRGASDYLSLLIWSFSVQLVGISLPHTILVHSRALFLKTNIYGALIAVILHISLAHSFGAMGSAAANLAATSFWVGMLYFAGVFRDIVSRRFLRLIVRPIVAGALGLALAFCFKMYGQIAQALVFFSVYWTALIISRSISVKSAKEEFTVLFS